MKTSIFALLFLLNFIFSSAQKDERFVLRLNEHALVEKVLLPFGTIQIIDARFDQVNIGCVVKDLSFKGMTENKMLAIFPENFTKYLPKVLSKITTFEKGSTDTLIMLVKQFRATDYLATTLNKKHEPESVLTLSCSFFKATSGQAIKISSFDDVLAEKWIVDEKPTKKEVDSVRIATLMNLLFEVFKSKNWTPSQTFFSIADVAKGIEKRFQLPLLHDTVLVAGIYKNFQEFQYNNPSIFEIQIGWQNDEIKEIRDAKFNLISPRSCWGICVGKYRYVSFLGRFYKLNPVDNSFRILFHRMESDNVVPTIEANYINEPLITSRDILIATDVVNLFKKNVRQEYLYLNLETGKVHTEELIGDAKSRNF